MIDIIADLTARGFRVENNGGGCCAMIKDLRDGTFLMITADDSPDMPSADSWMLCRYPGQWATHQFSEDGNLACYLPWAGGSLAAILTELEARLDPIHAERAQLGADAPLRPISGRTAPVDTLALFGGADPDLFG